MILNLVGGEFVQERIIVVEEIRMSLFFLDIVRRRKVLENFISEDMGPPDVYDATPIVVDSLMLSYSFNCVVMRVVNVWIIVKSCDFIFLETDEEACIKHLKTTRAEKYNSGHDGNKV